MHNRNHPFKLRFRIYLYNMRSIIFLKEPKTLRNNVCHKKILPVGKVKIFQLLQNLTDETKDLLNAN